MDTPVQTSVRLNCTHCGDECNKKTTVFLNTTPFCCEGCRTVYEIFNENGLSDYYSLNDSPGNSIRNVNSEKYAYLEEASIIEKISDFEDEEFLRIRLSVPAMHCSSCIWLLENLNTLDKGIRASQVNFSRKEVTLLLYKPQTNLRNVAELMDKIGYEPIIHMGKLEKKREIVDRSAWYKIGVAGFCFGNIMLLSLPEYFDPHLLDGAGYALFFRSMNILLALPALLYSASDYFTSAWASVRSGSMNIDVPIVAGLIVFFLRSILEIAFDLGPGWLDSLCGLIFFMSIGRTFQQKTYAGLSFDRDYKSYFPVSVTVKSEHAESYIPVNDLRKGMRMIVRNQEIIPADAILISPKATVDAAFVTGESRPVEKKSGDKIYAGCRNTGTRIELEVLSEVSAGYLTGLWNNKIFRKDAKGITNITDRLSRYFTPGIFILAIGGFLFWLPSDIGMAVNVFTAVLIVACPCAIALSAPFTFGNVLRILGRNRFYLKSPETIEILADADTIVFDKTGTLTISGEAELSYEGNDLSDEDTINLCSILQNSTHPLSQALFKHLYSGLTVEPDSFEEIPGNGIEGCIWGDVWKIGSARYCLVPESADKELSTRVYITKNGALIGRFRFRNKYRHGLKDLTQKLAKRFKLAVISGDNESERSALSKIFPVSALLKFNAGPSDKLYFISELQNRRHKVLMTGDGLNDAGALKQSDAGICITDNINAFTPAGDAILDAAVFESLDTFLAYCRKSIRIIYILYGISILYNIGGLAFALSGQLSPLIAAILMPVSSITVVLTATLLTNVYARNAGMK
jgi:Cu+-exporting ATPase